VGNFSVEEVCATILLYNHPPLTEGIIRSGNITKEFFERVTTVMKADPEMKESA
jgi:hypothetical protein